MYDLCIVGGGIIGSATALTTLQTHSNLDVCIVEKESSLAFHQSGRNSGVIHAGIYYAPGSLKAQLCSAGRTLLYDYLDDNDIAYKKCGKLVVATSPTQIPDLKKIYDKCLLNKVPDVKLLSADEIKSIEPYCEGVMALFSPHTGIVDYKTVVESYIDNFKSLGGQLELNFEVQKIEENQNLHSQYPITISSGNKSIQTRYLVVCGGLQSDRLATLSHCAHFPRIVPFRGDYLKLKSQRSHLVNGNIYTVPDPTLPFLGVHFTPRVDGSVIVGPTALFSFSREAYSSNRTCFKDLMESVLNPGLMKLTTKHWKSGVQEIVNAFFPMTKLRDLQLLIPELKANDFERGHYGIRAQAISRYGTLIDDFVVESSPLNPRVIHVRNAPSPAATASLAISRHILKLMQKSFHL